MKIQKFHNSPTDLFIKWTSLSGMTTDFQICEPTDITVSGKVGFKHRGLMAPSPHFDNYAAMWAMKVTLEYSAGPFGDVPGTEIVDSPGGEIEGTKTGANIFGVKDHYGTGIISGHKILSEPGFYRLKVWARSASTALPTTNGLIEVQCGEQPSTPYNNLIVELKTACEKQINDLP